MIVLFNCLRCSLHCLALPLFLKAGCEIQDSAVGVSGFCCALEQGRTQLWFVGAHPGYFPIQRQDKSHIHISPLRGPNFIVLETAAGRQGGKCVVLLWVLQMRRPEECQVALITCRRKMNRCILQFLLPGNRKFYLPASNYFFSFRSEGAVNFLMYQEMKSYLAFTLNF